MKKPFEQPSGEPARQPGTSRVAATVGIWGLAAGLASLIWLGSLEPFIGLPLTHPLNLALLALCGLIGVGFTAAIWLERFKN